MASLKDMLEMTMFRVGQAGLKYHIMEKGDAPSSVPTGRPVVSRENLPTVWSWQTSPNPEFPASIENIRCKSSNGDQQLVCSSIRWQSVRVRYMNRDCALELSKDYLLDDELTEKKSKRGCVHYDAQATTKRLYLDAEIDQSILLVFGFIIEPSPRGVNIRSFSESEKKACLNNDFVPNDVWNGGPNRACVEQVSQQFTKVRDLLTSQSGTTTIAQQAKAKVIVAVELIGCMPRADYSPGGIVSVARLYPHVFVWSNETLERISVEIEFIRPNVSSMACENLPGVDSMNHDMAILAVADQNGPPMGILPDLEWDNIFSYYDTEPKTNQEFVVVDPSYGLRSATAYRIPEVGPTWVPITIDKLGGQGAFDNVHIAPTMKWLGVEGDSTKEHIRMAPYCVHDCFHIHWRWGTKTGDEDHLKGWNNELPYQVVGAPHVPMNQRVIIKFGAATSGGPSLTYKAETVGETHPSQQWQIFCHHGCGYAYAIQRVISALGRIPNSFIDSRGALISWAPYYWALRYLPTLFYGAYERLRWDMDPAQNFAKRDAFRDL